MKTVTLTLRLSPELDERLARLAKRAGKPKGEFAREALRKQLSLEVLRDIRHQLGPAADAGGLITDQDVFDLVS